MRTKEIEQAGTACKQNPGMTSKTGTNVWARSQKNTPENESQIRGVAYLPRVKLPLLRALDVTEEEIQDGIRRGVLVVV